jgi:hypothetical protein
MTFRTLVNHGVLSLALFATPGMLLAQIADPAKTPAEPEIPMPPGPPSSPMPPVEVPAPPATPDVPPEHIARMASLPMEPSAYPPCSATLQDQCTNTRAEADVKAVHQAVMPMHNRDHPMMHQLQRKH